jgi:predicted lipoprotein with Yx(FWY)xxD motif
MASKRTRRSHVLVLAFGGLILAAGCTATSVGGSAAPDATAPTPAASASTSGGGYTRGDYGSDGGEYGGVASKPPAASADAGSEAGSTLAVGSGAAGSFLVGEGGMTLYVFQRDSTNTSACDGDCATNWPPLTVPGDQPPEADDAITGTLTVFTRSDGSHQVAYNGQPLYYFVGDSAPGDTNGQGLNDVWFVAGP